jgi:hypothetical protein
MSDTGSTPHTGKDPVLANVPDEAEVKAEGDTPHTGADPVLVVDTTVPLSDKSPEEVFGSSPAPKPKASKPKE